MNKIFISIFLSLCCINTYAQKESERLNLQNRIAFRNSIMESVGKKNLQDSLKIQIADYSKLTELLIEENTIYSSENINLKNELHKYLVLTSNDTLIFCQDLNGFTNIPPCLQDRVDAAQAIRDLHDKITATEKTAYELEKILGDGSAAFAAIREKIENDLGEIQELIHKIKGMNLSSFSEEQQKYFRPGLTDRYNNFKKYF